MRNRWFFMTMLLTGSFFFVVNLATPGWAAPPERGPSPPEKRNPGPGPGDQFWCPTGWQKAEVTRYKYTCKPKRPANMSCPEGWEYKDALHNTCSTSGLSLGETVKGCRVGCYKINVVPD